MSILARYRKPGGFRQLLQLIETSQPVKQEKLLEAVSKEDPAWADLIRAKKITPEMVLKWDIAVVGQVLEHMVAGHAAVVIYNMGEDSIKNFRNLFKLEKYNEIRDLIENIEEVKPGALVAANNNMLETVRYMDEEKIIDLRYIDPALDLADAA